MTASPVNAPPGQGADTLLVIGVHRAELAFGRAVAARRAKDQVDVLEIPEGLSGAHPRPDEVFRYQALHHALYGQLLAHVRGRHRLLIDLHTGRDSTGPCADVFSASVALREALSAPAEDGVRVWPLGDDPASAARTVVPASIWRNPGFAYAALEIYLPDPAGEQVWDRGIALAVRLINRLRTAAPPPPIST